MKTFASRLNEPATDWQHICGRTAGTTSTCTGIIYDGSMFDGRQVMIKHTLSTPANELELQSDSFDERYCAALLTFKQRDLPAALMGNKLLAVSFHGTNNGEIDSRKEMKAKDFIKKIGDHVATHKYPAIIGGDWNIDLGAKGSKDTPLSTKTSRFKPGSKFVPHLRFPERIEPSGLASQRYLANTIDYFCVVEAAPVS